MTDTVLLAIIAGAPAFVAALYNAKKVSEIHVSINSRMDRLLQITESAAFARGVKEGQGSENSDPDEASSHIPSHTDSSISPASS